MDPKTFTVVSPVIKGTGPISSSFDPICSSWDRIFYYNELGAMSEKSTLVQWKKLAWHLAPSRLLIYSDGNVTAIDYVDQPVFGYSATGGMILIFLYLPTSQPLLMSWKAACSLNLYHSVSCDFC